MSIRGVANMVTSEGIALVLGRSCDILNIRIERGARWKVRGLRGNGERKKKPAELAEREKRFGVERGKRAEKLIMGLEE
jgi:hypothetical protein